jgi:hypothetical protein
MTGNNGFRAEFKLGVIEVIRSHFACLIPPSPRPSRTAEEGGSGGHRKPVARGVGDILMPTPRADSINEFVTRGTRGHKQLSTLSCFCCVGSKAPRKKEDFNA